MNTNEHILIIDDEASLRQTTTRILQRAGYEVTSAANGAEGLKFVSEHVFDLVYLDIRMPDMNGLELLKVIHARHPDLPVILFTAQPDLNSAVEALRSGAADYLLKPLKPQTVVDRTKSILDKKQKERRKREIQRQIEALQAELNALENPGGDNGDSKSDQAPVVNDRFVRRGGLTLDLYARRATMNDAIINVSPTSFDYLLVLARHSPNVVDYRTLVSEAQGYETDTREAQELTRWHVHNIRQAVESEAFQIITIRGTGYRLVVE